MKAMVQSCAERGFEATSVADLLETSGISRASFYSLFDNKLDCFEATLEDLIERSISTLGRPVASTGPGAARLEAALQALAELNAGDPLGAHLCMIDAFAAGPRARARVEAAVGRLEQLLMEVFSEIHGREMPPEMARAMAGGVFKILQNRVARGGSAQLSEVTPKLLEWLLDQQPPPQALRLGGRSPVSSPLPPSFARRDPAERIMRSLASCVAEHGYVATTIAGIARHARISQRTFYEHFTCKEEATIAALDASGAWMLAATIPAIRRAGEWPVAMHDAYAAMCGYMAAEPDFAKLRAVEVYAAGPAALAARDRAGTELLEALVKAAPEETAAAKADPLLLEAIAAAIYALVYDCVTRRGALELPRLVPLITYLGLAPFVGPEDACEVANSHGRRRERSS